MPLRVPYAIKKFRTETGQRNSTMQGSPLFQAGMVLPITSVAIIFRNFLYSSRIFYIFNMSF